MKYKFKLGDRVKWDNRFATVIAIDLADGDIPYGIWLDERTFFTHQLISVYEDMIKFWDKGPNKEQRLKESKGYWVTEDSLSPAETNYMIIKADGKTVTATYYKDGNIVAKSIARCHPDDEFDFFTGAEIAMHRVKDTQPLVNGSYVYIGENNEKWTRGKVYVFTNGTTINDNNEKFPLYTPVVLSEAQDETSFFYQNFVKVV